MRLRLAALALALLLAGCSGEEETGLSLSVCVGENPGSLDPIYATEPGDRTILMHLYEPLMYLTEEGGAVPAAAQEVERETGSDGSVTYSFRLRTARWSDGRTVRAADFVYAWRRLADPSNSSPWAELLSGLAGFQEARESGDMTLLQVSARNETTLVVTVESRDGIFLTQVCTAPAAVPLRQDVRQEEGWDPTALVTNGPYRAVEYAPGDSLTLTASERYTGEAPGPERLIFRFSTGAGTLYEDGSVDAAWPVSSSLPDALDAPELETTALLLHCDSFPDAAIRQVLCLAADTEVLATAAGERAAEGLVPPGVPESRSFRALAGALLNTDGYPERRAAAAELLEQAGYTGAGLGELELIYRESPGSSAAAHTLCDQWKAALDVSVTPRGVTGTGLNRALESGGYALAIVELTADNADAEEFLAPWSREGNAAAYENSAYNTLLSIIAGATDPAARLGCLHDAEELLLADCVVYPLYTKSSAWALRAPLTGGVRDPRGFFRFAGVHVKTAS